MDLKKKIHRFSFLLIRHIAESWGRASLQKVLGKAVSSF